MRPSKTCDNNFYVHTLKHNICTGLRRRRSNDIALCMHCMPTRDKTLTVNLAKKVHCEKKENNITGIFSSGFRIHKRGPRPRLRRPRGRAPWVRISRRRGPRGVGCGPGGVFLFPLAEGLGRGRCRSPENFFVLDLKMATLGALWAGASIPQRQ